MSAHRRLWTCSPIKKILKKIGDSYQTYINYDKTHTMATYYGGIGNANDSEPQDINADIQDQDEYQTDMNDLENVETDHQLGLRALTRKLEQLWLTFEANDNDPMDPISHLECRLNQLALTLPHPCQQNLLGKL